MSKLKVMITGIGGGGIGEQILKSLRLSPIDYYIIGGDISPYSKGFTQVDKRFILPVASDPSYIETLLGICKKNDVKVLFYGSEPELIVIGKNRKVFEEKGIFIPINPQRVIDICSDKNLTMNWLKENGFNSPFSSRINSIDSLEVFDLLPAVLKPSVGGGGSVNTFIARDKDELLMFGKYLLKIYGEFIIQEYVGDYNTEYTVGVVSDMEGKYINSIAVKKNITVSLSNKIKVKNTTGKEKYGDYLVISNGISQGDIGRFPEVTNECRKIAEKLGSTGPINIQCRVSEGKVYVFEINPRISGTAYLRALVGYNEPDLMIRKYVLKEDVNEDFDYKSGYIARGLSEEYLSYKFMNAIPKATDELEQINQGKELDE